MRIEQDDWLGFQRIIHNLSLYSSLIIHTLSEAVTRLFIPINSNSIKADNHSPLR